MSDSDNAIRLVVVGRSGAGKTSFVANASGKNMEIGYSGDRCTKEMQEATVYVEGREVILYDTPGLDESEGINSEILRAFASRFVTAYNMGIRINGFIFMQSVAEPRVSESERSQLQLISTMVGAANYSHIAIATTMWDQISPNFGKRNEVNRADDVWKDVLNGGAEILQYRNTKDSAQEILQHLMSNLDKFSPFALKLQQDLLHQQGYLGKTEAGMHLQAELGQKLVALYRSIQFAGETPGLKKKVEEIKSWQLQLLETIFIIGKFISDNQDEIRTTLSAIRNCVSM